MLEGRKVDDKELREGLKRMKKGRRKTTGREREDRKERREREEGSGEEKRGWG